MRNKVSDGKTITCLAPYALLAGQTFMLVNVVAVAVNDALISTTVVGETAGVFTLVSQTGVAWVQGDKLYWDDALKIWTKTSAGGVLAGYAFAAKLSAAATGQVALTGQVA